MTVQDQANFELIIQGLPTRSKTLLTYFRNPFELVQKALAQGGSTEARHLLFGRVTPEAVVDRDLFARHDGASAARRTGVRS
jgi:hypothetical protein